MHERVFGRLAIVSIGSVRRIGLVQKATLHRLTIIQFIRFCANLLSLGVRAIIYNKNLKVYHSKTNARLLPVSMHKFWRYFFSAAFSTTLSRVVSVIKDIVVAAIIGVGGIADYYYGCIKVAAMVRTAFGEASILNVISPRHPQNGTTLEFIRFYFAVFVGIGLFIGLVFGIFAAPLLAASMPMASTKSADFKFGILIMEAMAVYLGIIILNGYFVSLLQIRGRFFYANFYHVIVSSGILFGVLATAEIDRFKGYHPASGAMVGLVIAAVIASFIGWIRVCFYSKNLILPLPNLSLEENKERIKSLPIFLRDHFLSSVGCCVYKGNAWMDVALASSIPGAVSYVHYADRLFSLPFNIVGQSTAFVITTMYPKAFSKHGDKGIVDVATAAIAISCFLAAPVIIFFHVMPDFVVDSFLRRGKFNSDSTAKTAKLLAIYSVGLLPVVVGLILTPIYYLKHKSKIASSLAAISLAVNLIASVLMMKKFGYVGIAMGTVCAAWVDCALMIKDQSSRGWIKIDHELINLTIKLMGCAAISIIPICLMPDFVFDYCLSSSAKPFLCILVIMVHYLVYIFALILLRLYRPIVLLIEKAMDV